MFFLLNCEISVGGFFFLFLAMYQHNLDNDIVVGKLEPF